MSNTIAIFINGLVDSFSKQIIYLSKSASFIILIIHEGCSHWASSFYSFLYQDPFLYQSITFSKEIMVDIGIIKKDEKNLKANIENLLEQEGGDTIELLLFGRKVTSFSLNEILFLLCKNSYDVDYKTFRNNFKEVNNRSLQSLYYEAIKDPELFGLMKNFKIDMEYFENLKKTNNLNFNFKRNGDILSNSRCGNLRF